MKSFFHRQSQLLRLSFFIIIYLIINKLWLNQAYLTKS